MIEQIKYINHMNEVIEFGKNGIFVNENDLHSFAWDIVSKNDKISSFKKGITKKALPVQIKSANGTAIRNKLFEVCEKDVIALKHGRLIIGDYYLKCYITGCKPSKYSISKEYMKASLTVYTDFPQWVKETTTTFDGSEATVGKNLDYNNDFPYDYASNMLNKKLNNSDFVASNFRIRIFGVANSPEINIGGHTYSVNVDIAKNEYLTIDSVDKTIFLTKADGSTVNCFNLRNKDEYIFEKIPSGTSEVSTSGNYVFDITLLEERGIPKWT